MHMGKTISFVKGKGSISHNNRDFIAENVDRNRTAWNVEYIKQPIREAYDQLFGEAIAEYNAKQKRKDRQVTDYLKDIKNSGNGEKQFYEIVVQIGKKDDTGVLDVEGNLSVDAKAASEILDEYARSFQERNPNLYLFNAVLHMDEATPHLHKVLQYDKFFNVKGLVEEFKEFVRPKSIKDRMEAKQKVVEKQKCEQVVNSTARREKDIAI